ncbi:MAG: DNA repair protein RecO [Gammaproteobacteria bacterium]|nr:DNA repair protein RecO [Gammaproteobacteria bacterium]
MQANIQEAFVIHSKPYKETSLIVTFLCRSAGKISAVAKGAKRKKSKFSGQLEPFQLLNIDFRGKGNLKTLYLAETTNPYKDFISKENLYSGFYINELINFLLVQSDESEELFQLYKESIEELKTKEELEPILRNFELDILANLGYQIDFFNDLNSEEEIKSGKSYKYSPQSGFRESNEGYDGKIIADIGNRNFSPEALKLCKEISRKAIEYYFEELNIKSRVFFR